MKIIPCFILYNHTDFWNNTFMIISSYYFIPTQFAAFQAAPPLHQHIHPCRSRFHCQAARNNSFSQPVRLCILPFWLHILPVLYSKFQPYLCRWQGLRHIRYCYFTYSLHYSHSPDKYTSWYKKHAGLPSRNLPACFLSCKMFLFCILWLLLRFCVMPHSALLRLLLPG